MTTLTLQANETATSIASELDAITAKLWQDATASTLVDTSAFMSVWNLTAGEQED